MSDQVITRDKFDAFANAKLDALLSDLNVNCLDFIGVDAAYCIDRTAKAAINRGFTASVICDLIKAQTAVKSAERLSVRRHTDYYIKRISRHDIAFKLANKTVAK